MPAIYKYVFLAPYLNLPLFILFFLISTDVKTDFNIVGVLASTFTI